MKKLRRKQIFTPVGEKLKWWNRDIGIGVSFSIRMASPPLWGSWRGRLYGIFRTSCVDCLNRFFGLTEPLLWIGWRRAEGSTSCRRFVIDLAKARCCDGEGSPCQRWGLAISVKSKENASESDGEHLHNRRTDWLRRAKGWFSLQKKIGYSKIKQYFCTTRTCQAYQRCSNVRLFFIVHYTKTYLSRNR